MGLFDVFKKKEKAEAKGKPTAELTIEEQKLDKMWDLLGQGKIESPYAELMT